jgi:hypothetical protein
MGVLVLEVLRVREGPESPLIENSCFYLCPLLLDGGLCEGVSCPSKGLPEQVARAITPPLIAPYKQEIVRNSNP